MSNYDPQKDAVGSYYAAIEAKRERGDAAPWRRKEVIGDFSVTFVGDEQLVSIYAVSAAQGEPPVYVGSTAQILRHRIRAHVLDAKKGSALPFHAWLRSVPAFTVEVLERVPASARIAAEQKWVAHFPNLLNVTDGGPGLAGHRFAGTDHARRIAAKIRTAALFTCEQCGAPFYRKQKEIRKGNCRFCSRSCYAASLRGVSRPVPVSFQEKGVAAAKAAALARTHCRRGHPLSGDNLYINKRGARVCKECRKEHKRAYLQRHS